MSIKFDVTAREHKVLFQIAERAVSLLEAYDDSVSANMDVTACHCNGCPLKLEELLHADDENFAHDLLGIRRHLNRDTGELMNCFLPRYSR